MQAVLPFAFVNIYVVTLNQLLDVGIDKVINLFELDDFHKVIYIYVFFIV